MSLVSKLRLARSYLRKPARVRSFLSGCVRCLALAGGLHERFRLAAHPKTLFINLTNACNAHCKMCQYESSGRLNAHVKSLTLDDVAKLVDEVAPFRPTVSFVGGGEPLCNRDVVRIVDHVHRRGLFVGLTTNGLLLERMADELVAAGIDYVTVSLDGPEAIHDDIRGRPGLFAAAMRGIRAVQKHPEVVVQTATTVSDLNYRHALELFALLRDLAIDAKFGALMMNFLGEEQAEEHNRRHGSLFAVRPVRYEKVLRERMDLGELLRVLDVAAREHGVIWEYHPRSAAELEDYFERPGTYLNSTPIRCPWLYATITNEGNVVFCIDVTQGDGMVLGNFRETPFTSIWTGARAREFRRVLAEEKRLAICSRCCAHVNPWNGL